MVLKSRRRSLRDAIVVARQNSRQMGIDRLVQEAAALGVTASGEGAALAEFARDWRRAEKVARGYRRVEPTEGQLERIAVSESSEAFSSGRTRFARSFHSPDLIRVWDSERDACPICFAANGTMVGIHENFPLGEPGDVHPWCRCGWTLLSEK